MSEDAPASAPDPMALMTMPSGPNQVSEQDRERAVLHALFTGSTKAGADLVGVPQHRVRRWIKAFPFNEETAERIQAMRARATDDAWATEMAAIAVLRRGIARYSQLEQAGTTTSLQDLEQLARTAQRVASILALLGELELKVRITNPSKDEDLERMNDGELLALAARLETERDARDVEQGDANALDVDGKLRRSTTAETAT